MAISDDKLFDRSISSAHCRMSNAPRASASIDISVADFKIEGRSLILDADTRSQKCAINEPLFFMDFMFVLKPRSKKVNSEIQFH